MGKFQVTNSPFNQEQVELLNLLLPSLTKSQKIWLSGYFLAAQSASAPNIQVEQVQLPAQSTRQAVSKEVTILYGSQTGNAEGLAAKAGKTLEEKGFQVTVSSMNDFKPNQLKKVENLLILVSTHGEGDPPDTALPFYEFLHSKRAPKVPDLRFSVLSLGDSSYEFFCKTGKDFDQRLEELDGKRIAPRVDCDLDFEDDVTKWLDNVLNGLSATEGENQIPEPTQTKAAQTGEAVYSRKNPFRAEVLENINLNGRGSNKETRHLELSLEGSGLTFEPGDSLGIYPENDTALVDQLLEELRWDPEEKVTINKEGEVRTLKEALVTEFEITVITKALFKNIVPFLANKEIEQLASNNEEFKAYANGRDLLDLLRDFGPWTGSTQEFVSSLRKMPPRLYSIASSLAANPDEVHLTIGAVRYDAHGRERKGVCSILCAERLEPGDTLPIFIQANKNFKLPSQPETPIIMVGPGTGIAPFRSFMQEREETGSTGKSWMFFGDQHFVTDFLYQTEWQKWVKEGVLTNMDVAFSRDTEEKIYVQHRLFEHSKELFQWLQEGAIVYVCGDKDNMAKDVHQALLSIIEKESGMSPEKAETYLVDMKQQKRYQRDVY